MVKKILQKGFISCYCSKVQATFCLAHNISFKIKFRTISRKILIFMNFFTGKKLLHKKTFKASLLFLLFVSFYFLSAAQSPVRSKLAIQLLLNTNGGPENTADGVVAFYADNFSYTIGNEDSYKLTNPDENLAIDCRGTLLSIDGRPTVRGNDTLNLAIWTFRQKAYYLKFTAGSFTSAMKAVIKDNYLKKETIVDLSSTTLLPFAITTDSASYASNRFAVIFRTKRVMPLSSIAKFSSAFKDNSSLSVFPNPVKDNTINLRMNNMTKGRYEVSLYSQIGELVYSGFVVHNGNAGVKTIKIDRRLRKGMYSLLLTNREVTIKKNILFQ